MKKPKYNYPKWQLTQEYEYVDVDRKVAGATSGTGEMGYTWTETYTDVKASIHPLSNANKANFQQLPQGTNWSNYRLMVCEFDVDIQVRDRVNDYDGNTWYIHDIQPYPQTHKEFLISTTEEV